MWNIPKLTNLNMELFTAMEGIKKMGVYIWQLLSEETQS